MKKTKKSSFRTELIAPCGMNCAICSRYLSYTHDLWEKGIEIPYCPGCRPRDRKCAFIKKKCKALLNKELEYCFECADFPCKTLEKLDGRYRMYYKMSMIDNLKSMKKNGIDGFLKMQEKEWRCPECGGARCCHNGLCYTCSADKLKKLKRIYRWQEA